MSTALAKVGAGFTLAPTNWKELLEFAELAAKSDLVPKDYRGKPANVVLAVQWGGELGVAPLQALQGIAVINGRAAVYGDLMLALCMQHPDYVDTIETYDEKTQTATCIAQRKGRSDKIGAFSQEDVKRAGLGSTHNTYPKRMKQFRARGFALRDQWTDVLKGMISAEEAKDYPKDVRAEVVSSKNVDEPKPEPKPEERKSTPPPPAASVGPAFAESWPDKAWAGKPLQGAPGNVLSDYAAWVQGIIDDPKRARFHKKAQQSMADVEAELQRLLDEEAERAMSASDAPAKPDDVAVRLQQQIDAGRSEPSEDGNASWGLEAPQ